MKIYDFGGQALRDLGAKKFVLVGVGRIGCTPYALAMHRTNGSCVEEMNTAASIFNRKLRSLGDQFKNRFRDDFKFTFVNNTARNLGVVARGAFLFSYTLYFMLILKKLNECLTI